MKKIFKSMVIVLSVLFVFSMFCTAAYAASSEEISSAVSEDDGRIKTFDECLDEIKDINWALICGAVTVPGAVGVISIATPLMVFLPISLPVSAVAGVGASLIGIINVLFIPLEAIIMYMVQ